MHLLVSREALAGVERLQPRQFVIACAQEVGSALEDAAALGAGDALAMATIEGARALGLESEIGSIEVGKKADVIVVDLEGPHALPGGDAVSRLVYACTAADVRHVFVDGRWVVNDRALTTLDLDEVRASAKHEAKRLHARAGLS